MADTISNDSLRFNEPREEPRQSNQMVKRIIDSLSDGIYALDKEWNFIFINERVAKLAGHKASEMVGKNAFQFFPKLVGTNYENRLSEAMLKGRTVSFEWKGWYSDEIWEVSVFPFEEGVIVNSREITERRKADEVIKESEERFFKAFRFNPAAMTISSVDGQIVDVNDSFERLLGYTRAEVIGKSRVDLWLYAESSGGEELGRQLREKGSVSNYEMSFRHKSGKQVRVIFSLEYIFLNKKAHLLGTGIDITERKKAEEALWKAKNDWERTFDSVPDFIAVLDNQFRIVRTNRAMAQQLGVTPEKAIGLFCYQCVHGLDNPPDFCPHAQTVKDGKEHTTEVHEPHLGGDFFVSTTPLKDEKGSVIGSIHVARNITERKRTEEVLMENQDRLKRSQEIAHLGSWELDLITDKLTWSDEVYRIFGLKPQEFGATYEAFLSYVHPDDRTLVDCAYSGSLAEGRDSYEVEHRVVRKDTGEIRFVHEKCAHFRDLSGHIIRSVGMVHDITERKQLEKQVEKYTKHLENLVEERTRQLKDAERLAAIGATAGMVGHDIRNPLQAITSDVYLLKTELDSMPPGEEKNLVKESLEGIEKNIDYINKIVADLQDFARPLNPHAEETDLKLIIDDLLSKNGLPENVNVSVKIEETARKVLADSTFINRIMFNLVNNAVQAMPKGGRLTIHAYEETNDIIIAVKDTGVGIPDNVKNKLFTPMFTTKSKGQGFGLPVVKRMTESLGGTVTFESQEGKGTTFIVRLPPQKS